MTNAIVAALDTIFADPNIGQIAIWRAGGAQPGVPVRIVLRRPDRIAEFGETRLVTPVALIDLRIAEVPSIAAGDSLEVNGEVLIVQAEPIRDAERLIWTIEARAA